MEGTIVSYRRGRKTQTPNQMVIKPAGYDSKDKAAALVGKKVTFKTIAGTDMNGLVAAAHGNSGAVRVRFETGMPGQAIGKKVSID